MTQSSQPSEPTTGSVAHRQFAIVVSRYHNHITGKLLDGAIETLEKSSVPVENIHIVWVPGAWEITLATQFVLEKKSPDAVICLGCVVRGETTHDQYINATVSHGLGQLGLEHRTPIAFGLLTCNTMDQAVQRAGGTVGNKGIESAEAVIELLKLFDALTT